MTTMGMGGVGIGVSLGIGISIRADTSWAFFLTFG